MQERSDVGQMTDQLGDTSAMRERVEDGRQQAADSISQAADSLRERGDGATGQMATKVAGGMERTAGYLRDHDTEEMRGEVETYVREHPVQSLGAAIAAGFVIGRMLR